MMTDKELVNKLKDLADNQPSIYALGMWGQLLSESIIVSKAKQIPDWYTATKQDELRKQIGKKFGFDCVCMIKSILWGWSADRSASNGGAKYASNGVPDISADSLMTDKYCTEISEDFSKIVAGEAVWIKGHVGVYIGDGLVIECTPRWKNGCQYTVLDNIKTGLSGNRRRWTKHGKMKFIQYNKGTAGSGDSDSTKSPTSTPSTSSTESSEQTGLTGADNETKIFNYLIKAGYSKIAAAGIMGNIKCESGFRPQNLQGVYETKFKLSDEQYTAKVNSGKISENSFYNDHAGYGLAQWTYWSRKKALYDYIMPKYKDISSLIGQCEFLVKELKGYKLGPAELNVYATVKEVSDIIVKVYEKPYDQNETACVKRANAGLDCLNKFLASSGDSESAKSTTSSGDSESTKSTTNVKNITSKTVDKAVESLLSELELSKFNGEPEVKTFSNWLKERAGLVIKATIETFLVKTPANLSVYADYNKSKVTDVIKKAGTYTIVGTMNGMGKLKSGYGWIELNKVVRK